MRSFVALVRLVVPCVLLGALAMFVAAACDAEGRKKEARTQLEFVAYRNGVGIYRAEIDGVKYLVVRNGYIVREEPK